MDRSAQQDRDVAKARLTALVDNLPAIIWHLDTNLRYISMEGSGIAWLHVTREEMVGMTIAEYLAPFEDGPEILAGYQRVLQGERVRYTTHRRGRTMQSFLEPIVDERGAVTGVIGIALDVTEKEEADRQIARAEAIAHLGSLEVDVTTRTVAASDELERLFARSRSDLQTIDDVLDALHPADRSYARPLFEEPLGELVPQELEFRIIRPSGEVRWISGRALVHGAFRTCSMLDITERKNAELRLLAASRTDAATGLHNRSSFTALVDAQLLSARVADCTIVSLALLGTDDIFQTLGSVTLDTLVRDVSLRIRMHLPEATIIGRAGDLWLAMFVPASIADRQADFLADLNALFERPFPIAGHDLYASVCLGTSVYPSDGEHAETLLRNAESAMRTARDLGRGSFAAFVPTIRVRSIARMTVDSELRLAIERGELELYMQPIVSAQSGTMLSAEALIRWNHPTRGLVLPGDFIPNAEESGQIIEISRWVLAEAARACASWHRRGHALRVAVNVSPRHIIHQRFLDDVFGAFHAVSLDPAFLELEITETVAMTSELRTIEMLGEVRARGAHTALDDFGTGHSSLAYLKKLPVDSLKIDRTFITDIENNLIDRAIAQAVVSVARTLDLRVVAEGIETADQLALLLELGCTHLQGYLIGYPLPLERFESYFLQPQMQPARTLPTKRI